MTASQTYPVTIDLPKPEQWTRVHLLIRIVIFMLIALCGLSLGLLYGLLFLSLPVLAAITIADKGPERYLQEDGPRVVRFLRWILAFYAYLSLLTERFPDASAEPPLALSVETGGRPSAQSAVLRVLMGLPSLFVLSLLGCIGSFVWLLCALWVFVGENVPPSLHRFLLGILRWSGRLLVYQASLVEPYPPFSFRQEAATPMVPAHPLP